MKYMAADGDRLEIFDCGFEIFEADCADCLDKRGYIGSYHRSLSSLGAARRLCDSGEPRGREETPWSNFYEILGGNNKRERQ